MPRRLLVAGALAVVIVVAAGLLLVWSPWSSGSGDDGSDGGTPAAVETPGLTGPAATSSGQPNAAGVGDDPSAPTLDEAKTGQAVCALSVDSVRGLAGTASGVPAKENLRDAVDLLQDRVAQLQIASEGRPAVVPLVTQAEELLRTWRSATAQFDAAQDGAAQDTLNGSTTQLSRLEQTLAAVPADLRDC